jgi:hypothetical protein
MRHSLHAHIVYLENLIQDVRNRLTRPALGPAEVEDLQLQLTLAESALDHYRRAYELELSASGSTPPDTSADTNSGGNANGTDKQDPKKRSGLAAGATKRARRNPRAYIVLNPVGLNLRARLP